MSETMVLSEGQILRLLNVYIVVKGKINILSKKNRSCLGCLQPGDMIALERILPKSDP